jgi:uncharacterized membrane protein YbhN (UPF0104 family)
MQGAMTAVMNESPMEPRGSFPRVQLLAGALGFVGLTGGVFWWLFAKLPAGHAPPALATLRWEYLALLLLVLPLETVTSSARIWLICRVLHPGVSFGTCVQSELGNVAISILTPSQSGGGPGQIYMLSRRGHMSVGAGLTATLISFMGTLVGLLLMGVYSVLVSGIGASGPLLVAPVWTLTVIATGLLLGAIWPDVFRIALGGLSRALWRVLRRPDAVVDWWPPETARIGPAVDRMDRRMAWLADLLYTYRAGVRRFLRHGKTCAGAVCLLSVAFLLARALTPYLCARFLGVDGGTLRQIVEAQVALIFLVFFAPTPGSAGIAEAASLWIMADLVPPALAPYYTLLWRVLTTYLTALAGFVCLGLALARDASRAVRHQPGPR